MHARSFPDQQEDSGPRPGTSFWATSSTCTSQSQEPPRGSAQPLTQTPREAARPEKAPLHPGPLCQSHLPGRAHLGVWRGGSPVRNLCPRSLGTWTRGLRGLSPRAQGAPLALTKVEGWTRPPPHASHRSRPLPPAPTALAVPTTRRHFDRKQFFFLVTIMFSKGPCL